MSNSGGRTSEAKTPEAAASYPFLQTSCGWWGGNLSPGGPAVEKNHMFLKSEPGRECLLLSLLMDRGNVPPPQATSLTAQVFAFSRREGLR